MSLILVTVDTEEAWDWSGPFLTRGYSVDHIFRLCEFQELCSKYNVRPTYFANYAVMADTKASEAMVKISLESGTEIGMHIHPWNTPPIDDSHTVMSRDTYLHNAADEQVRAKLGSAFDAHLAAGVRPISFRGGRYSSSKAIQNFLIRNGFKADCSIVPYSRWSENGSPDYRSRDIFPRRIDVQGVGGSGLWEIPLTLGFTRKPFGLWAKFYDVVENSILGKLRTIGIVERVGIVSRVWLNFETDGDRNWEKFLKLLLELQVPTITITVHSTALFSGLTPYTRDLVEEKRIFERIEKVFRLVRVMSELVPATVNEAAEKLEADHLTTLLR
jgi:hypothetical protein